MTASFFIFFVVFLDFYEWLYYFFFVALFSLFLCKFFVLSSLCFLCKVFCFRFYKDFKEKILGEFIKYFSVFVFFFFFRSLCLIQCQCKSLKFAIFATVKTQKTSKKIFGVWCRYALRFFFFSCFMLYSFLCWMLCIE